ncbi:transposase, partial [Streptomyces hygroscopicus]|uniref:transposase n=1 Tax=Streptomyces hygroscopicus TaxID=1912 RepID=UPI00363691FB
MSSADCSGAQCRRSRSCAPRAGRRADDRKVLAAMAFAAAPGRTWRQSPPVFGRCRPTVCRRFARWSRARVRA